jgi:hypothetical protein
MRTSISQLSAAANAGSTAWTEYRRHIAAGGIVPSTITRALREGRYAEALAWLLPARDSDFLERPVYTVARPNRHAVAAISRTRKFARRSAKRADERNWRREWDFALRTA